MVMMVMVVVRVMMVVMVLVVLVLVVVVIVHGDVRSNDGDIGNECCGGISTEV